MVSSYEMFSNLYSNHSNFNSDSCALCRKRKMNLFQTTIYLIVLALFYSMFNCYTIHQIWRIVSQFIFMTMSVKMMTNTEKDFTCVFVIFVFCAALLKVVSLIRSCEEARIPLHEKRFLVIFLVYFQYYYKTFNYIDWSNILGCFTPLLFIAWFN